MKLVIIILNKIECLEKILESFKLQSIPGATIIDSKGMIQELNDNSEDYRIIGSLRELFSPSHTENKTIIMAAHDEDVKKISTIVNDATGGLDNPDTGVLFTLPIDHMEGLKH